MWQDYPIVGSYNNQRFTGFDAERTINLFEYVDSQGKKNNVLFPTSGLTNSGADFTPTIGGFRGQFVFTDTNVDNPGSKMYMVIGQDIYYVDDNLTVVNIGTLTTNVGYVGIDANTFQVIFVDGQFGYIWDTNEANFEQITDTGFPSKPIDVCYLDGFFIVANGDTNTFQLSSYNEGLVWSGFSTTFTADSTTDLLTVGDTDNFATTVPVQVSNMGGALPVPLTNTATYYSIRVSPTTLKLAASYQDAVNGIFIDITTNGSGTNTIRVFGQLQLGTMTSHPGTIVACRTLHRRLFLFSQNYTEVWENQGIGTNLPFRRNNSLLIEYGTPAIASIRVGFDRMFFLSQDKDGLGSVMQVIGANAFPVSNRALDFQISQYAQNQQVSDATGILIKENGLIFYRLNFTAANHTYVYNFTMSSSSGDNNNQDNTSDYTSRIKWHEEEVLNGNRHPGQTHGYLNGINYYGDYKNPILYVVDSNNNTNNNEPIRRVRIGKPIGSPTYKRLRIDRYQLDVLQGEVDNIPENISPIVFLSYSKDGGQTYGAKLQANMGKIGQRTFRTVWRKLGTVPRGQYFVPMIEFFNEIKFVILGAAWVFEEMPE